MTSVTLGTRLFTALLSFVTGAGVGFVLTFTHRQYVVPLFGVPVPWGLIGALAIVAALVAGMRLAFGERLGALAAAAGVIVASSLMLVIPTPGGSTLVIEDLIGFAWALGPAVLAILIIGWPRRPIRVRSEVRAP